MIDSHSHVADEVTRFALNYSIEMLSYVPNDMHVYQGLDTTCFRVLKTY